MLSAGQIIGGAFALVRERFGSVLVWGLLYSLGAFALGYFMMSTNLAVVLGPFRVGLLEQGKHPLCVQGLGVHL